MQDSIINGRFKKIGGKEEFVNTENKDIFLKKQLMIFCTKIGSNWINGRGDQHLKGNVQINIGSTTISITDAAGKKVINSINIGTAGSPNVLVNSTMVKTKYLGSNEGIPNKNKAMLDEKINSNWFL